MSISTGSASAGTNRVFRDVVDDGDFAVDERQQSEVRRTLHTTPASTRTFAIAAQYCCDNNICYHDFRMLILQSKQIFMVYNRDVPLGSTVASMPSPSSRSAG